MDCMERRCGRRWSCRNPRHRHYYICQVCLDLRTPEPSTETEASEIDSEVNSEMNTEPLD